MLREPYFKEFNHGTVPLLLEVYQKPPVIDSLYNWHPPQQSRWVWNCVVCGDHIEHISSTTHRNRLNTVSRFWGYVPCNNNHSILWIESIPT